MSKFSGSPTIVSSPVRTSGRVTITHEGGVGYERDAKSELFLLGVTNMVREGTFYETAKDRDERFTRLIAQVTKEDPAWVAAFVPYIRDKMHLRSASLVMAAEYVAAGGPKGRAVVASSLQRADEPAEMLGYWRSTRGRSFPKPIKRGVADAVRKLYNERAALRYDGQDGWRMADVIEVVHPEPFASWQGALFRYLLARRHNRDEVPTEGLPMIAAARALEALPVEDRRAVLKDPQRLADAGFSWERLSGWLQGPMDAEAWEAIIPSMGYMALLRNLRNFEQAKVSKETIAAVNARIADPEEVAKSKQLPLRFYSAWKATGSTTFGSALEDALDATLVNVPALSGRTLVLIDVSGSMQGAMSNKSTAARWELAALFGGAVARRAARADVYVFDTSTTQIIIQTNTSILRTIDAVRPHVGGGTSIPAALQRYDGHDRVVLISDEQTTGRVSLPDVPVYTFNVAGYKAGHSESSSKHHTFGGLTDAGFAAIEMLEKQRDADWSFLVA